jgi:outer membrane protein OmpA-like peptidoglycan-associated protein
MTTKQKFNKMSGFKRHLLSKVKKRALAVLVAVLMTVIGFDALAQIKDPAGKAEREFSKFSYIDAVYYFKQAYERDTTNVQIALRIADSFRLLNLPDSMRVWYEKVIDSSQDFSPSHYLNYAESLMASGNSKEAEKWYKRYSLEASTDSRTVRRLEGLKDMNQFFDDSRRYDISELKINAPNMDFSPAFYDGGIVFVSSRTKVSIVKDVYAWDESDFLDLFYWKPATDSTREVPVSRFYDKINTKYHEGPLCFFHNDSSVVFTRNNYNHGRVKKSADDVTELKLYFAHKNKFGEWVNIEEFEHNNNEFSVGHPAITADGKKLIFSSEQRGGFGGTDLYISYNRNGKWTRPKNMGPKINTEGNEMFASMRDDYLFFASNGHPGIGGLDIYKAQLAPNDTILSIENMGYPINTNKDDFGLIMDESFAHGYFSSNRGEALDDIYEFHYNKPNSVDIIGEVRYVIDNTIVPNADVVIQDTINYNETKAVSSMAGVFTAKVPWDHAYEVSASKEGWKLVKKEYFDTHGPETSKSGIVVFMQREELILLVSAVDKETRESVFHPHVVLKNIANGKRIIPFDSTVQYYKYIIKPTDNYSISVTKNGYFSGFDTLRTISQIYGTIERVVPLEKIVIGKAIKLENIYYDLNKANIRPDAAIELNKLVKLLNDNPEIRIELSSHTDARGSDAYNLNLSQRRATSAVNYIFTQGIARDRIIAKGYGEILPVNRCSNGVACTEDEHQQNRRTEFKVISITLKN